MLGITIFFFIPFLSNAGHADPMELNFERIQAYKNRHESVTFLTDFSLYMNALFTFGNGKLSGVSLAIFRSCEIDGLSYAAK